MHERRLPHVPLVGFLAAALALLLAVPASAAPVLDGSVRATGMAMDGVTKQAGHAQLLHVDDLAGDLTRISFTVGGGHIRAYQYDDNRTEAFAAGFRVAAPYQGAAPRQVDFDNAAFTATAVQPDYVLDGYFTGADLSHAGAATDAKLVVVAQPVVTETGITEYSPGAPAPLPAPAPSGQGTDASFTRKAATASQVVTTASGVAGLHLAGSFVLELQGISGRLAAGQSGADLESGRFVANGSPAPEAVRSTRQSFLRIIVTDGTLDANVTAARLLQWSDTDVVSTTLQGAFLTAATGTVRYADGSSQHLASNDLLLEGRARLDANPSQGSLLVAMKGLDESGAPLAPAGTTTRLPDGLLALGSVGFLLAGALVGATVLLLRRPATMADVEAALEAGHYRSAARSAGRILRRKPGSEEALISRAVALSKAGKPSAVVAELTAHLARTEPSDGVMHYVLGLAYIDLGSPESGATALREAMTRTPGLTPQVAPRLAAISVQQPSSGSSGFRGEPVDPHGYA